jgi:hypothetical protein
VNGHCQKLLDSSLLLMMNQIEIYKSQDEKIEISVQLENESVWLTIEQMAMLFEKSRATVNDHILNVFKEKELQKVAVIKKIGNSDFLINELSGNPVSS